MKRAFLIFALMGLLGMGYAQLPRLNSKIKLPKTSASQDHSSSKTSSTTSSKPAPAPTQSTDENQEEEDQEVKSQADAVNASPARMDYKTMERRLNDIRRKMGTPYPDSRNWVNNLRDLLDEVDEKIADIRQKDPNLNVSEAEQEVAGYRDQTQGWLASIEQSNQEKAAADAQAELDKWRQPIEDDGMTSSLHTANPGKILFSQNAALPLENPVASEAVNSCNITQPFFLRVFLEKSLENHYRDERRKPGYENYWDMGEWGPYAYQGHRIKVNGVEKERWVNIIEDKPQAWEWTTYKEEIIPDEEWNWNSYKENGPVYFFNKILQDLKPGSYTIELEYFLVNDVHGEQEIPIANGSFNLNFTQAQWNAWEKKHGFKKLKEFHQSGFQPIVVKNSCGNSITVTITHPNWKTEAYKVAPGGTLNHRVRNGSNVNTPNGSFFADGWGTLEVTGCK